MNTLSMIALYVADASVIIGAVVAVWKSFSKFKKDTAGKLEKVMEGIQCQHRSKMCSIYYRNKEKKQIRQYEFEDFLHLYDSYKALGGNGLIDTIHDEVVEWEIVS